MKKLLLPALLFAVLFTISCKKANEAPTQEQQTTPVQQGPRYVVLAEGDGNKTMAQGREGEPGCVATEVTLIAGQTINSGTVSVTNDSLYIYVTYTATNGWKISQTHLYVGDCALIPVNNPGNPIPGQFPYASAHANVTSYTYQIPLSQIPAGTCGCIAAHAVVKQFDANNQQTGQETAWGNGVRINLSGGNWGMKFDYCSCVPL
ncbi:MAG: hypothetical protein IPL50_07260 [Chitinophagaceae bacterium]|nr:hypothetical protein [Chitinophagaceae bacterium]